MSREKIVLLGSSINSAAALTSNSVVLGAGGMGIKTVAGITTNGTSKLTLGVAGSAVGTIDLKNATSGTITLTPPTGALGTVTLTLPIVPTTDTLVGKATTDTLTNKTLTDALNTVVAPAALSIGYLGVPSNPQSTAYSTVLADEGKSIDHLAADTNARTFTIDGSLAYPVGACISFSNMTANVVTIAIGTDTLYLVGAGTTGSRSLAQYGVAVARKQAAGVWMISGTNLT